MRLIFLLTALYSGIFAIAAENSGWECLGPAVDRMNIHLRVEASAKATFGIEIAEGDTTLVRRFLAKMPSQWPDDMNNSFALTLMFSGELPDSAMSVSLFANKPKTADISMKISGRPSNTLLELGDRAFTCSVPVDFCDSVPLYVRFITGDRVTTLRNEISYTPKNSTEYASFESVDQIIEYLANTVDPYEGLWTFYDRTTSPLRAAPNGEYVLATVKSPEGYDLVFIDEREGVAPNWKPLTIKGRLVGCDIPGVFDLMWYDRDRCTVGARNSAVIEENFLTASFPYYKTSLRFNRVSLKNR